MKKKLNRVKRVLCLCLALLLPLSLVACDKQAEAQDSTPPTASVEPTITPTPTPEPTPPIPYTDVPENSFYYDAVVWAYENGITSDGETFGPADACTRGQVITFLWRAMGSPEPWIMENPFSDASPDAWYYKAALWAYQHNIAASTTVNPGNPCTNAEALTFLWRAKGKPVAAVDNSTVALSASGAYYAKPAAWADNNGLFDGIDFEPTAPCLRADIVSWLCWSETLWAPKEEEQIVQKEYEQILYSSQNYANYADYIDIDGDGKEELLTLKCGYEGHNIAVTVTVYADINGHVGKNCEGTGQFVEGMFSICTRDGQIYLHHNYWAMSSANDDFYKVENGSLIVTDQIGRSLDYRINPDAEDVYWINDREIAEAEYPMELGKYENISEIFSVSYNSSIMSLEQGILPDWEERGRYWTAYWEASDPMYAAVLNGDFSDFAGTYSPYSDMNLTFNDLTLDKNGILTGDDFILAIKPSSVTVREDGVIYCELATREEGETGHTYEYYEIYPVGVGAEFIMEENYQDNPNIVRIIYKYPTHGADQDLFSKVS